VYIVLGIVILLLALAPLASVLVASFVAGANGCALDEGSIHPCLVGGADRGEALYTMAVAGWLMLLSLPLGVIGVLVLAVILAIHRYFWSRKARAT
ncbi:MAG TPA: hypothetical protein VHB74_03890, partial [Devosia sp.]|nr:hypothetical protein [Devosia sp.]